MTAERRLPYPGLRAFTREESDLFFGRDGCIAGMIDRLAETRFLAVLGTSGSGKSSIVRTGLLDGLEIGLHARAGTRWVIADFHPGGQPMRNLAEALLVARGNDAPSPIEVGLLRTFLMRGPRSLVEWCRQGNLEPGWNLLLLVDQFEELFRYADYAQREEAEAFVALLIESAGTPDVSAHVVVTMRSEYMGACGLLPGLAERINAGVYLTPRMTRSECREAIEGPAGVAGFVVEPALVNRLLNDTAALAPWEDEAGQDQLQQLSRRADQLPLMQHVLNRLWQRAAQRAEGGEIVLTQDDYERIGGIGGALDAHAEEILARIDGVAAPAVARIFRALVDGTSPASAVRRPCRLSEIVAQTGASRAEVVAVVDAFRAPDCNFLRPPEPQPLDDDTIIDISHESLIRQWSLLSRWLVDEARAGGQWRRLLSAAEAHRQGEADLLSGLELANFSAWWTSEQPLPAWAERYGGAFDRVEDFLEDSRAAEQAQRDREERRERRERNRLRAGVAVLVGMLVLVSGMVFYVQQKNTELEAATGHLEQANSDLAAAGLALERRRAEADDMRRAAEVANDRAVRAANDFLIDMTERLRRTPNVPMEEVEELADKGRAFLSELTGSVADEAELKRAIARLALQFGMISNDRRESDSALEQARFARETILGDRQDSELSTEELVLLARSYLLEASNAIAESRYPDAQIPLGEAERIATAASDMAPNDGEVLHLVADSQLGHGINAWYADEFRSAASHGEACLDAIQDIPAAESNDRLRTTKARCQNLLGLMAYNLEDLDRVETHFRAAVATIEQIPEGRRDTLAIHAHAAATSNLAWLRSQDTHYAEARVLYEQAAQSYERLIEGDRRHVDYQYNLVNHRSNIGLMYHWEQNYAAAHDAYKDALKTLEDAPDGIAEASRFVEKKGSILSNLTSTLVGMGYETDPERMAEYVAFKKDEIAVQERLSALDGENRITDIVANRRHLATSLLNLMRLTDRPNWSEVSAVLDDAIQACDLAFEAGTMAFPLKRECLWSVEVYPQSSDDIPAIAPERRIAVLEEARARFDAFLDRDPDRDIWTIEHRLGRVQAELARLYARVNRPEDALAAATASADLHHAEGLRLLVEWFETGAGPVAADTRRAADYAERLAAAEGQLWRISAHATPLWQEDAEPAAYNFPVWDPRHPAENSLARVLHQLEAWEGLQLVESVASALEETWESARAGEDSFVDLVMEAVGQASLEDRIARQLYRFLQRQQLSDALRYIVQELQRSGGPEAVDAGVRKLLADVRQHAATRTALRDGARQLTVFAGHPDAQLDALGREAFHHAAILLATALIDTADGDPDELAQLHQTRGSAQGALGRGAEEEADYAKAVSLAPDDPNILNSLGYHWVTVEKYLPAAVQMLERATTNAPDDPYIRDSLGWAYVVVGRLDEGLALIESAAAEAPEQAEIQAHLADALRRLGRTEEARKAFAQALALDPDERVRDFIDAQTALFDMPLQSILEQLEPAIAAIAEAVRASGFAPDPRISTDALGIAIRGYDPVAYILSEEAVAGQPEHFALANGAIWLFSSAENRRHFEADPERYTPAYGGYCAFCVAAEHKLHGAPQYWAVHEGRLYLHEAENYLDTWLGNPDQYITLADDKWTEMAEHEVTPIPSHSVSRILAELLGDG